MTASWKIGLIAMIAIPYAMSYEEWLESSILELRRAEERLRHGEYAYACFHAERAVQFSLKALLPRHGNFLRVHDLRRLYERARRYGFSVEVGERELRELTIRYAASRYPDARRRYGVTYDEPTARRALETAKRVVSGVVKWLRS